MKPQYCQNKFQFIHQMELHSELFRLETARTKSHTTIETCVELDVHDLFMGHC